jgi:sterol desaturase/sphingolipid hydroxylase (fatty acid hydroxylase superfamily)
MVDLTVPELQQLKQYVIGGAIALLWLGESAAPHFSAFVDNRRQRLTHGLRNLLIALINLGLATAGLSYLIVRVTSWGERQDIGVVRWLDLGPLFGLAVALLLFDMWMYWWHRINHRVPLLWRFHRMHHSDRQMDVTSALRFHPGEIVLSSLVRLLILPIIGMSAAALLCYEIILLPVILLHHSNINVKGGADRLARVFIVTPWMHWVHHSRIREETNSNYGSVLSVWDRVFGITTTLSALHLNRREDRWLSRHSKNCTRLSRTTWTLTDCDTTILTRAKGRSYLCCTAIPHGRFFIAIL